MDRDLARRVMSTMALNAAAQALALAQLDPSWGSEVHRVGDGWLVLSGEGMYVNRAMAVTAADDVDLDNIVSRCRAVGVAASIEVTPLTSPGFADLSSARGFFHDVSDDVSLLVRPVPGSDIDAPDGVTVRSVSSPDDLRLWQDVSAVGWGHTEPQRRAASDAFSVAAHVTDDDGMVIAFDAVSETPMGCASVTIREGMAMLGGMSTDPEYRRRGVQAALLRHRLQFAEAHGCDQVVSTAASGSASERNLHRHGFEELCRIETWVLDVR